MVFLAEFSVMKPGIGYMFWTTLIFLVVWFFIGKFAVKPIAKALKDREDDIASSLEQAERARAEISALQAKNEDLLAQAREERSKMLREAKDVSESIINDARTKAREESARILQAANQEIQNQKMAAITDINNQAGKLAIDIAGKVIKKELSSDKAHQDYVQKLIADMKLN